MKKAIITGATGLVGKAVVKYLISKEIDVLCLGRKDLKTSDIKKLFGYKVNYLSLNMQDILSLKKHIDLKKWSTGEECVFFNFAWSGENRLTDGSFEKQLNNSNMIANAVKVAKELGCIKFVNIGTLEETYAQIWLNKKETTPCTLAQVNYAIAKLATKDMCSLVSYLSKIDYIHTRLSVPLDFTLSEGTYISNTLKKIVNKQSYEKPTNSQLFDIISTDDVAKAYYLIGKHGKNKADYFIGTSNANTLNDYFNYFEELINNQKENEMSANTADIEKIFNTSQLEKDTGFKAAMSIRDIKREVSN